MERRPDRFMAFIDACTLVGALQRDMLLTLAEANLFRIRWSRRVLDEMEKALVERALKGADDEERRRKAAYVRTMMLRAFPEACVEGFEQLETAFQDLPDKDDAHVVAAAIRCNASVIVTENVRDFPPERLSAFDIMIRTPDAFIADSIDLDPDDGLAAIRKMRARFQNPAMTPEKLIEVTELRGLPLTAELLRENKDQI